MGPTEAVEDPIAKMLKKMMSDLSEIKSDVKTNNTKIDGLTQKVEDLETKNKITDEKNENKFKEIREEIANVEANVTTKLMSEITPSLEKMKTEIQTASNQDLRRIVQEEVELMRLREAKQNERDAQASGDDAEKGLDPEKTKKSKKNIKTKNPKKNEEEVEGTLESVQEEVQEEVVIETTPQPEKSKKNKITKKK